MATVRWSDLPSSIVSLIATLADSDIDLLRLRSVCSSWRSFLSLPPRKKTSLPALKKRGDEFLCMNPKESCNRSNHGSYNLIENTLYRLSSPIDPSVGWMFKASNTNANNFPLLIPLSANTKLRPPPHTIPKHINLLDYQISEISKSYRLQPVNCEGSPKHLFSVRCFRKVIPLFNYVVDCEFAALGFESSGDLSYWRSGDENWTPLNTKGRFIQDAIFFDGRCYAIDRKGLLFVLDSKMQLTVVVASSHGGANHSLVKCDSDLYVASETCGVAYEIVPGYAPWYVDKMKVCKLNKCDGKWDCVEDLGDKIFLLSEDGSAVVSAKDFHGCKGNCVYFSGLLYKDITRKYQSKTSIEIVEPYGHLAIIYHLDKKITVKMHEDGESRKLYWPPPSWLMPNPSSTHL
ncbi:uncharacterized protein [Phyllobates terribilis]|uniref:uncharacterized protein n=1 Tax=Phyllobates terribilis TaxID=111132 RepID=UPI003CCAF6D7